VRVANVVIADISEELKHEDRFVWVGLFEPDEELLREIQEEFGLHDLAIEDARDAHQRPKLEQYGDCLFVVLRTAHLVNESQHVKFGETHVFVGPRFVVSVRHFEDKARACPLPGSLLTIQTLLGWDSSSVEVIRALQQATGEDNVEVNGGVTSNTWFERTGGQNGLCHPGARGRPATQPRVGAALIFSHVRRDEH
jgi:hypothetical protein